MTRALILLSLLALTGCSVTKEQWNKARAVCGGDPKLVWTDGDIYCEKYGHLEREEVDRRFWLLHQEGTRK